MGRIQDLISKRDGDGLSEDEEKELQGYLSEADDEKQLEEDDEKAIDEAASKIASKAEEKVTSNLESLVERIENTQSSQDTGSESSKESPDVRVTSEARFIHDPRMGKKSVDELSDQKVEVPGRAAKGKQHTQVSARTTKYLQALIENDKEKLVVLQEGNNAGNTVPEEFLNMIVEDTVDQTVMRQLATVMTVDTDTIHLPQLSQRPNAAWRSEAASKNTTTADFSELQLTPHSIASIASLSDELVADASLGVGPSIVNYVANKIAVAIGLEEDKAFFVGDGSGKPTGVETTGIDSFAASSASESDRADLVKQAPFKLAQGYRPNGVWVMNSRTMQRVWTYKDADNNYLLQTLPEQNQMRLVGRPVYEQNNIADGEALFGDFSFYHIADRLGMDIRASQEASVAGKSAFEDNLTHVRVEKRTDGNMALTSAVIKLTNLGAVS